MAGFQKSSQMTRETLRYFDAINCKNAEVGDIFSCQRMLKEQLKRVSEEARTIQGGSHEATTALAIRF